MKCSECGKEFEGKFCPQCGKSANIKEIDNVNDNEMNVEFSEQKKDFIKDVFFIYLNTRLKYLFLGAFLSAIYGFSIGNIISGISLTIAGILLMPPILKRCKKKQYIYIIIVVIVCLFVGIFSGKSYEQLDKEQNTKIEEENLSEDGRYQVGQTIEFTNGDKLDELLTIISCNTYIVQNNVYIQINYELENLLDFETLTVDLKFKLYADGYMAEIYPFGDNINNSTTLGGGRKLNASIYYEIDPSKVSCVELECGDSIIVLKDTDRGIDYFSK